MTVLRFSGLVLDTGSTAAAGCNHTLFLVIDRWDDDAEVEEAGGRNQACDIAALDTGH